MPTLDYDPRERRTALIEVHEVHLIPYSPAVRRQAQRVLSVKAAAELQDALWRRRGDRFRFSPKGTEEPASTRCAATGQPAGTLDHALRRTLGASREERDPAQSKADEPLLGELHRRLLPEVGRGKGRLARGSDTPLPNRDRVAGATRHASPCEVANDEDGDDDDRDPQRN